MKRFKIYISLLLIFSAMSCAHDTADQLPEFSAVEFQASEPNCYDVSIRYQQITNTDNNPVFTAIDFQNYMVTFDTHAVVPMDVNASIEALAREYTEWGSERYFYRFILDQQALFVRDNTILCYETSVESYTGGAHGGYSLWYECFDLETGSPYDFGYLFEGEWAHSMRELIYAKLVALEPSVDVYLGSADLLPPSSSVLITDTGLVVVYQPYEAASFSAGILSVEITDAEVEAIGAPLLWCSL